MITVANDLSSRRHGSDLSHFGERGQNLYTSSVMHSSGRKSFDHDSVYSMSLDKNYEADRGMNCLDILAGVVSRCSSSEIEQNTPMCTLLGNGLDEFCRSLGERDDSAGTQEHRVSCHRCGNIRKRKIVCVRPQVTLNPFCYDLTSDANIIQTAYFDEKLLNWNVSILTI